MAKCSGAGSRGTSHAAYFASDVASAVDIASGIHLYVKHHSVICIQCAAPQRALGGAPCAAGAALLPLRVLHTLTKQSQSNRCVVHKRITHTLSVSHTLVYGQH